MDLPAPNNAAYNSRNDNLISVMADTGHDAAVIAVAAPVVVAVGAAAAIGKLAVVAPAIVAVVDSVDDDAHAAFMTGPNGITNETIIVTINHFLATFHRDDDGGCKEESLR